MVMGCFHFGRGTHGFRRCGRFALHRFLEFRNAVDDFLLFSLFGLAEGFVSKTTGDFDVVPGLFQAFQFINGWRKVWW